MTRREIIENTVKDLVADLLFYDRKEDEELPNEAIQAAIEAGEITENEIAATFAAALHEGLG